MTNKCLKLVKRSFGKYEMLLESLENEQPYLQIDDFLVNPKTNATIAVISLVGDSSINMNNEPPNV